MCFTYAVNFSAQALQSKLNLGDAGSVDSSNPYANVSFLDTDSWEASIPKPGYFFSGFEQPQLPVLVGNVAPGSWNRGERNIDQNVGEQANISLKPMQWGLIPSWAKSAEKAQELFPYGLNARAETIEVKPMFRDAWKQSACVIPASGFFEWKEVNKKKYPHYIQMKDESVMLMAGIFSQWMDPETGELQHTYAIVTTEANALMQEIHNVKKRMPVILDGLSAQLYLGSSAAERKTILQPCDNHLIKAQQVGEWLNNSRGFRNLESAILEVKKDFPQSLF
jgi:putative SOS response-associated peptidase YedK